MRSPRACTASRWGSFSVVLDFAFVAVVVVVVVDDGGGWWCGVVVLVVVAVGVAFVCGVVLHKCLWSRFSLRQKPLFVPISACRVSLTVSHVLLSFFLFSFVASPFVRLFLSCRSFDTSRGVLSSSTALAVVVRPPTQREALETARLEAKEKEEQDRGEDWAPPAKFQVSFHTGVGDRDRHTSPLIRLSFSVVHIFLLFVVGC